MSTESVMPSNHLILCHPLLLLPSLFPRIRIFSSESVLHIRWPKYWSFSFIISPSNEHLSWFPLGLTGLISLQSKGLSRVFFNTTVQKHHFNSMPLRFVIAFLPRSKPLLISWLQSPSAVIPEPKKIVCHCLHCFSIYLPWSDGTRHHDPSFLNAEF